MWLDLCEVKTFQDFLEKNFLAAAPPTPRSRSRFRRGSNFLGISDCLRCSLHSTSSHLKKSPEIQPWSKFGKELSPKRRSSAFLVTINGKYLERNIMFKIFGLSSSSSSAPSYILHQILAGLKFARTNLYFAPKKSIDSKSASIQIRSNKICRSKFLRLSILH